MFCKGICNSRAKQAPLRRKQWNPKSAGFKPIDVIADAKIFITCGAVNTVLPVGFLTMNKESFALRWRWVIMAACTGHIAVAKSFGM